MAKAIKENTDDGVGKRILIELYECENVVLDDVDLFKSVIKEAAAKTHATIMSSVGYKLGGPPSTHPAAKYFPDGLTVFVGLEGGHIICHTEVGIKFISIDILTCDKETKPRAAVNYILSEFKYREKKVKYIDRFAEKIIT